MTEPAKTCSTDGIRFIMVHRQFVDLVGMNFRFSVRIPNGTTPCSVKFPPNWRPYRIDKSSERFVIYDSSGARRIEATEAGPNVLRITRIFRSVVIRPFYEGQRVAYRAVRRQANGSYVLHQTTWDPFTSSYDRLLAEVLARAEVERWLAANGFAYFDDPALYW